MSCLIEKTAVLALVLTTAKLAAEQPSAGRTAYRSVEVASFSFSPNTPSLHVLPEDWRVLIETELVKGLAALKGCELVARESSHVELPEPSLRLAGTFTKFRPGNRQLRFWLGVPGIGTTIVDAHVKFLDRSTGAVLAEKDVHGWVYATGGFVSPSPIPDQRSLDAARDLASSIVQFARKNFFH